MPTNRDNVISFDEAHARRRRSSRADVRAPETPAFDEGGIPADFSSAYEDADAGSPRSSARSSIAGADGTPRAALYSGNASSDTETKRRRRSKERASRMFDRQFGSDDAPASSSRAALYRGELGRSHRRAISELDGDSSRARASSSRLASRTARRDGPPALFIVAVVVGVVAFAGLFLYSPAKSLYTQVRDEQRAEAEYQAVVERNEAMTDDIEALKTDEGIEDEARSQLGWVSEGEEAVVVKGLDDKKSANANDAVHSAVVSSEVKAPATWYSPLLDKMFDYPYGPDEGASDSDASSPSSGS